MEAAFYNSASFNKETLHSLMQKNDHPAMLLFVLMTILFFSASIWIVHSWHGPWWEFICAHFLFGVMTCSIFACLHETAHSTAFKSKAMNQFAAGFCGIASIYPAPIFRDFHFMHHRFTHIPGKDPEISIGNKAIPGVLSNLPIYFAWLSGLPFICFKIFMVLGGCLGMPEFLRSRYFPFIRKDMRGKIAFQSWLTMAIYLCIFILAQLINAGFYAIFTGLLTGQCILATYLLPEHNGLPHEGTIFDRTRSMRTSKLIRSLMWNMPYHAEHHAYPAVPFHTLPRLHNLLKAELSNTDLGYPDFHVKVLQRKIS